MPTRLGYAILFVSDLDRAIGFYRDVIGVPLRFRADAYAEFATEGARFALFPRSELPGLIGHYAPPDPAPWPQGEAAFFVDDVDGEHARLQDAGVPVLAPPTDGRGASGRCTSPTRTGTWWSSRGPNNLSDSATAAASSSRGRRRVDQAASASSSSWRPPRQRTTQSRCPCWMPVAGSSSNAP